MSHSSQSATHSSSQYMKNKLSKSRLEVVDQSVSGDSYTGSLPPRNSYPRKSPRGIASRIPNRSLFDDTSSRTSLTSSHASRTTKKYYGKAQEQFRSESFYADDSHSHYAGGALDYESMGNYDMSTVQSPTSLISATSSDLCLPLPYSKFPNARPMFGREEEMATLLNYLKQGATVTSLIGVGGIGKSHLATHASRKWFAQQSFSRFVIWLNAATELSLRVSYIEALQQVLMGNSQPDDEQRTGEVITVAELLLRQLRRQKRKELQRQKKFEENQKRGEVESRDDCTQVLSEDSCDLFQYDNSSVDSEENVEIDMDTKTLGKLLWDSLLQGVPQEYEWLMVVQNLPGGMGGIKGMTGFRKYFFPISETPKEEWIQGRILLMSRHQSFTGQTSLGKIKSVKLKSLDENSAIRMMIANAVFNSENEIGKENLASPHKDQILKEAERTATKIVGPHYLDGNPLMIVTAIGVIVSTKMTLAQYYTNLKQQVAQALESSGYSGRVQTTVKRETAMSICLEQAMDNAHAKGLADILSAGAFVCPEGIPLKLLSNDEERVQELCNMNLLSQTGKETYSMHRVHQRTAVDAIVTGQSTDLEGKSGEIEEFMCTPEHAVSSLRSALLYFQPEKASTWRYGRSYLVHVEALRIHHDVLERKKYLSPGFNRAYYADIVDTDASIMQWAMKDRKAAINLFKEALRLRRALHRQGITGKFSAIINMDLAASLSQTLTSLGGIIEDDREAQVILKEALDIYVAAFGEDAKTIELMTLYIALADVDAKLQNCEQAYSHYKKAIELYFLIYGHNQNIYADNQKTFLAETLQKIGNLSHHQMKNHAEAELYLEGSVSLLRHLYDAGSDLKNREMASALETLGSICHAQGKMKEARKYYKSALAMKASIHGGPKSTDIRSVYGSSSRTGSESRDLSHVFNAEDNDSDIDVDSEDGKKVDAINNLPGSKEKEPSEKDAKMARTLHRLGIMSWNLGSLKQAEDYFEKTLSLQRQAYGDEAQNEEIAITLFSMGGLCNDLHHDQKKASLFYREALDCYYASCGRDVQNESIAHLLHALGQSLQLQGKLDEARSCLKKVRLKISACPMYICFIC